MAVDLYDGVTFDGLFNLQGKAFASIGSLNTARLTTIPAKVLAVITAHNLLMVTNNLQAVIAPMPSALSGYQSSGGSLASSLAAYASNLLIEMVDADSPMPQKTAPVALAELIRQMLASSDSVDASAVTVAITPGGSNIGDGRIVLSTKRGDGRAQENMLGESLAVTVANASSPATASLSITGEAAASSLLGQDWPAGSGARKNITAVSATSSLLANGDMEDETIANIPDGWIVSVGTVGTTVKMTIPEIQTIIMSGSPSAGYYTLSWAHPNGKTYTTDRLAYNASSSSVQTELRKFPDLASVVVVQSGTTPNLTHTVTFTGFGGNVAQISSTNSTTGGSIAHATSQAGTPQVYAGGKALWIVGDGSQITTLNQKITLEAGAAYAFSGWFISSDVPAAGVITIDLVDGIGGAVIADDQAVNNSFTFNCSDLTTSWRHILDLTASEPVFRAPTVLPAAVYLRIRASTAITNTKTMFVDHLALSKMEEVYPGGPLVKAFSGAVAFNADDVWTIATTNDRGGVLQEYYNRTFGMAQLGLLLPSNASASETIPDTVVA